MAIPVGDCITQSMCLFDLFGPIDPEWKLMGTSELEEYSPWHMSQFFMEAERLKFKVVLAHRIFQLVTHYYGQKSAAMLTVVM